MLSKYLAQLMLASQLAQPPTAGKHEWGTNLDSLFFSDHVKSRICRTETSEAGEGVRRGLILYRKTNYEVREYDDGSRISRVSAAGFKQAA